LCDSKGSNNTGTKILCPEDDRGDTGETACPKTGNEGYDKKGSGDGVFSNVGTYVFLLAGGSGYGVVADNATKQKTYMKMRSVGVGFGMGVKDFRAVFIFKNKDVLNKFVEKGWEFGGQADAAAKSGEKGGAASGEAYVESDIIIYELTEAGVALQATVGGTKFWKDKELN